MPKWDPMMIAKPLSLSPGRARAPVSIAVCHRWSYAGRVSEASQPAKVRLWASVCRAMVRQLAPLPRAAVTAAASASSGP